MSKLLSYLLLAACILWIGYANAATYPLPDPAIFVNPNYSNTTTIVQIAGVTYRGPSQFYYVSECAQSDSTRYRCNILAESGVVLTATDHTSVTVSLTMQDASVLITSGHNQWRNSQIVLSGTVSTP